MSLGLFCAIGGLFMAAGFKEAVWPKVIAIVGLAIMIVGGIAGAVISHRDRLAKSKTGTRV